jgi:alkanesulfonate monooxygenase SsuD/methylene tetrahydromethanopterin reductase-like flavin-dependent oxidoreductase (luciferase family)
MSALRFAAYVMPDAPFPTLAERCRRAEEAGFDAVYTADHTRDFRHPGPWFDCWTAMAAMAAATSKVRIGTMVSNPIIRPPVLLAQEALALDHLSGGRLELGIGTGIAGFDHDAMGSDHWTLSERARRFAEYVEIVDGVLRSGPDRPFGYKGEFHRAEGVIVDPAPVQQPRPPITVAGQSPTVLRVAAERADAWNTHGPFGAGVDEILEVTRRQSDRLDELCVAAGRQPGDVRRSLLCFWVLDAWESPGTLADIVSRFSAIGLTEFVVTWPEDDRQRTLFEDAVTEVIPALRRG